MRAAVVQEICVRDDTHYNYIYNDCRDSHTFSFSQVRKQTKDGGAKYTPVTDEHVEFETLRDIDWQELYDTCEVYRDHMNGIDVHHSVTWFLLCNLVRIKGGEARFFEGLQRRFFCRYGGTDLQRKHCECR